MYPCSTVNRQPSREILENLKGKGKGKDFPMESKFGHSLLKKISATTSLGWKRNPVKSVAQEISDQPSWIGESQGGSEKTFLVKWSHQCNGQINVTLLMRRECHVAAIIAASLCQVSGVRYVTALGMEQHPLSRWGSLISSTMLSPPGGKRHRTIRVNLHNALQWSFSKPLIPPYTTND